MLSPLLMTIPNYLSDKICNLILTPDKLRYEAIAYLILQPLKIDHDVKLYDIY